MARFYFDEIINITGIDAKVVYDKVSRVTASSEGDDYHLELDVHSQLYPMLRGDKYRMVISDALNMDGSAVAGNFTEDKQKSLADKFEYVMHGLLYKMSEEKEAKISKNDDAKVDIYISFGGLQLKLSGTPVKMQEFRTDQRLFLLLRKM